MVNRILFFILSVFVIQAIGIYGILITDFVSPSENEISFNRELYSNILTYSVSIIALSFLDRMLDLLKRDSNSPKIAEFLAWLIGLCVMILVTIFYYVKMDKNDWETVKIFCYIFVLASYIVWWIVYHDDDKTQDPTVVFGGKINDE